MKNLGNTIKWVIRNFFFITGAVFIINYLYWFRVAPIAFGDDTGDSFLFGLLLLAIYIFIIILWKLMRDSSFLKSLLLVITIPVLLTNIFYLSFEMPYFQDSAQYNGMTYYLISSYIFDPAPRYPYNQLTEWNGFTYKVFFLEPGSPLKLIHDNKLNEVSVVKDSQNLMYTLGDHLHSYEWYTRMQFRNHLYYVSQECNGLVGDNNYCDTLKYSLYECDLDNTGCNQLPFEYVGDYESPNLQVNEQSQEINFYLETYANSDPGVLIYTYGEHPRCYVEGCSITDK